MLKGIIKLILNNYNRYPNIIFKLLSAFLQYPIYFLREFLNITKSVISTILSKSYNKSLIIRKINGVSFLFDFDFSPAIPTYFIGTNQISITKTMLKFLKKGDTLIDVGANIGHFSAVGAGLIGKKGEVHSFEPVPSIFNKLLMLQKLNKSYNFYLNNFALGETPGAYELDSILTNSSVVPKFVPTNNRKEKFKVKVKRLDDYFFEKNIKKISLIKIDVEGFEFPVLKGLTRYFETNKGKSPPIIVEIVPRAYPLLGYTLDDLENFMKKYSYLSYTLDGMYRIDFKKFNEITDVLFKQS